MNIKWNADKYAADFSFVYRYGEEVMQLLELPQGAEVIDLGCGNGALSQVLADKGYSVTGIDASAEQLALARKAHPDIRFIQADATSFTAEPADAVFSNAVFHWIDREQQPQLLSAVYNALKLGGQLVFEMGGAGNNRIIHRALSEQFGRLGRKYDVLKFFPTIGEYSALLEAAGFDVRYALLFDRPTQLKGEHGVADWIELFCVNAFDGIDIEQRHRIALAAEQEVRGELFHDGKWYADYVRLRMKAVRPE